MELRIGVPALRRFVEPVCGRVPVLFYAIAVEQAPAQLELGLGIAAFGGLFQRGLDVGGVVQRGLDVGGVVLSCFLLRPDVVSFAFSCFFLLRLGLAGSILSHLLPSGNYLLFIPEDIKQSHCAVLSSASVFYGVRLCGVCFLWRTSLRRLFSVASVSCIVRLM